jgi:hypothetical protein
MVSHPKCFISHSTADKARFVIPLAEKLRKNGVDAWIDQWEILPGDSLADKIFNEGIGQSDNVIIVISENSIQSHWVKEELNNAVIKKIEGKCRIIPIIIDKCTIPPVLNHLKQIRINDLAGYENEYQEILSAIFQKISKTPLGNLPLFLDSVNLSISDLSNVDLWILDALCKSALSSDYPHVESVNMIIFEALKSGIPYEQVMDSITILNNRGYIKAIWVRSGRVSSIQIPTATLDTYCRQNIIDYRNLELSVISCIINEKKMNTNEIAVQINAPNCLVTQILLSLKMRGKINATQLRSGSVRILSDNFAELKRMLI